MTTLEQVFNKTIEEYGLIKPQDKVLIAVSGGTDSTALLFLLNSLKSKYKLDLHVAHLNHMIRKGDSELDVRYVQNLADNLKIPITVEAFDVQAFAKEKKMGLEAAARQVRYAFLHRLAEHIGADKIAVGHTADDNVETFLMRLLRGAGLKGLCGIPVRRGKIVRPMIKLWRRDLEDYVGYLKLVPRRDYTNYESHYTRNRVRMKLLPQLRLYNLNIKEIILQTVLLLTEDKEFIDDQAQIALHSMIMEQNEDTIVLEIGQLKKMSSTIQSHVIRLAIKEIKGDLTDLSFTNIHDIVKLLDNSEKWELHLPGGIFANGYRGRLSITHQRIEEQKPRSYRYALKIPGEVELKEISRRLKAEFMDDFNLDLIGKNSGPQTAFIDAASLGRELVIRSKEDGDRFMPYGMKGTKKLQDIFVDAKIPFELRDSLPVVESHSKIVWVAGLRIDDRAKVTKASKKVIRLELL